MNNEQITKQPEASKTATRTKVRESVPLPDDPTSSVATDLARVGIPAQERFRRR